MNETLETAEKKKRKSPDGEATNDLVLSAHVGTNDEVFPFVLSVYVAPGSVVADVTYGKGVFWRNIPNGNYDLRTTDLAEGIDCRELPYDDASIDCVVFDPPFHESLENPPLLVVCDPDRFEISDCNLAKINLP